MRVEWRRKMRKNAFYLLPNTYFFSVLIWKLEFGTCFFTTEGVKYRKVINIVGIETGKNPTTSQS